VKRFNEESAISSLLASLGTQTTRVLIQGLGVFA